MLARNPNAGLDTGTKYTSHLILCGGSNMRHTTPYLQSSGLDIHDLTPPARVPSDADISALSEKISSIQCPPDTIQVFELFGNATYCYQDFDGMQSINNMHHLSGPVEVLGHDNFGSIVKATNRLLTKNTNIIPPLPNF